MSSGYLPVVPATDIQPNRRSQGPTKKKRKRKHQPAANAQTPSSTSASASTSTDPSPSPVDSGIYTINPPPSTQSEEWQTPEPPGYRTRMSHFTRLLLTHPYNIHGDLYPSITQSYLLLLTAALMESQSASDPGSTSVVRNHASPNLEMVATTVHECLFVQTRTLAEHLQSLRMLKRANPAWRVDPFNFCIDLKPGGKEAEVWLTSRGTGDVGAGGEWGSWRESVSVVFWRREEEGRWVMWKHVGIRGPGGGLFPWCDGEEFGRDGEGIGLPGCCVM